MAAKKNKIMVLDEDDSYEEVAVITCRTALKGPQFVAALNQCAHLNLRRIDLTDNESELLQSASGQLSPPFVLPTYSYTDDSAGLVYRVVDAWFYPNMPESLSVALQGCDKIIIFYGMSAYEQQQFFYARLSAKRPIDPDGDCVEIKDEEAWNDLVDNIIDINYFDYSDRENPKSSQWQNDSDSYSPRLRKTMSTIERFIADITYMIDECEDAASRYAKMPKDD